MPDPSSDRNPVEALAEEFLERCRRGERPSLTEYTNKCPSLAGEIRDLFPALLMMEDIRPSQEDTSSSEPGRSPGSQGKKLERLGDYRILREVGRGGMGVVYEAEQESLGRHVALKVLPGHALLDPQRLRRFQREARSAARLHHTNIVPVFGVGEDDGLHYYVMQFIPGQSLDQVLAELRRLKRSKCVLAELRRPKRPKSESTVGPESQAEVRAAGAVTAVDVARGLLTGVYKPAGCDFGLAEAKDELGRTKDEKDQINPSDSLIPHPSSVASPLLPGQTEQTTPSDTGRQYWQSVARLGIQVADALAYAHSQGTLHRDIKPSNLLLDPQGTVWVTDFGLAKAADSDDLTHTGDIVGTVRYMAPERFGGKSEVRSDLYGLGITLYEMLTLRRAFDESDQSKLVAQILHQEPPRPRKLNPAVPRDLETIVLKAMAKEPAHRYVSAAELAEDLKRFTELRPIRARRVSAAERLWRWSWRNPIVASMAAGIFFLLVVVTAGSLIQNAQLITANQQANAKLWESLRDRARAERINRHVGQRVEALRPIAEAMQLPLPPSHTLDELRTEAVAALALPDIEIEREWQGGFTPGVVSLAFDGNLEKYARLAEDGSVTVRQVSDDSLVARWKEATAGAWPHEEGNLQFSPDGRYLAVRHPGSNRLVVRRLDSPEPAVCYRGENATAEGVDFTPDGTQLIHVMTDTRIAVVALASGETRYLPPTGVEQDEVAIAPDGRRFAIQVRREGKYSVEVRDLATGQVQVRLAHPAKAWSRRGWHPDGRTLATCCDDLMVRLWDVRSSMIVRELEGHKTLGIHCAFGSTGRMFASNDWNSILHLWEVSSGRHLLSFPAAGYDLLRVSPDDRLAVLKAGDATGVQLLHLHESRAYRTIVVGAGSLAVAVHPEGRLLGVDRPNALTLIDLATGREVARLPISECKALFWESSGALLTGNGSGLLRWPMHEGQRQGTSGQRQEAGDPIPDPWSLARSYQLGRAQRLLSNTSADTWGFSADGQTIAIPQYDRGAVVLHRGPPQRIVRLEAQADVRECAVSPDGRWVATGSHSNTDGFGVKVWETATGRLVKALPIGESKVAFSPDGRWLLTTYGGCRVWDISTWTEGPVIGGPQGCFSTDSRLLAVDDSAGAIRLVSTGTWAVVVRLESPEKTRLTPRFFTPDGTRLIATGIDTEALHIWDLREVRRGLAELSLDWDEPAYPPLTPNEEAERIGTARPLQVTVDVSEQERATNEAWLLATNPDARLRDPARAVELAQKAVKLAPKEAICWNTLGVAHYRAGHWKEAIAALTRSMELQKGALESYDTFFLAMAHWQLGEKEKARQRYDWAAQWLDKNKDRLLGDGVCLEELNRFRAEAAELVAPPEIQFDPPPLSASNFHKAVLFEARVVSLLPSAPFTVDLILKPAHGKEQTHRMVAEGDRYRITTIPVPPSPGPLALWLRAEFDTMMVEGNVADQGFRIGDRELKLTEVSAIRSGAAPRAVLHDGRTIAGNLTGLDAVPVRLGKETVPVNLGQAKEVRIVPAGLSDWVVCSLLVRQGKKEVCRQSWRLRVQGIPSMGGESVTCIDLQPWTNQSLGQGVVERDCDLGALPVNECRLAGVGFHIGPSFLQLGGQGAPGRPNQIDGIVVGRHLTQLHILHATHHKAAQGTVIGQYTITFGDGTTAIIPIRYGIDVLDWWYGKDSPVPTEGKVAWEGENGDARRNGAKIRLYLTTWQNPKPEKAVKTISFARTSASTCAPFCVAMTAEAK
jgi:serine/threonine protein kinase/WD40 repeat protein